jgi:uncharacterized protein YjiS (DUF1127 family)
MTQVIENIASWLKRQEKIRKTRNELNMLNDKDLADIGISRCDIDRISKGVVNVAL